MNNLHENYAEDYENSKNPENPSPVLPNSPKNQNLKVLSSDLEQVWEKSKKNNELVEMQKIENPKKIQNLTKSSEKIQNCPQSLVKYQNREINQKLNLAINQNPKSPDDKIILKNEENSQKSFKKVVENSKILNSQNTQNEEILKNYPKQSSNSQKRLSKVLAFGLYFVVFLFIVLLSFAIGFFANGVWRGVTIASKNSENNLNFQAKQIKNENSEKKSDLEKNLLNSQNNSNNYTNSNSQNYRQNLANSQTEIKNSSTLEQNLVNLTKENQTLENDKSKESNPSKTPSESVNLQEESSQKQTLADNQNQEGENNSQTSLNSISQEQKMKNEVIKILDKDLGNFTVYFKNLKTGQKFDIKGDKSVPPASISKLPAAILTLKAAQDGEFSFKDGLELQEQFKYIPEDPMYNYQTGMEYPIGEYVRNVITGSDNTAMRHLEFLHGGVDIYAKKLSKLGIKLTRQPHITTAIDVGEVFEGIYQKRWLNQANTDYLLQLIMTENKWNSDRLVLAMKKFPKARVAHKIGQVKTDNGISYHDAGIIFGKTDFVIVILNQDTTPDIGITKIHEISQYLYQEINN